MHYYTIAVFDAQRLIHLYTFHNISKSPVLLFHLAHNKFFLMYILILASIASIARNNFKFLGKDIIEFRLNVESHNIARLAQSVEHETLNLRVVGSSPTLGDIVLWLTRCKFTIVSKSAWRWILQKSVQISNSFHEGLILKFYQMAPLSF